MKLTSYSCGKRGLETSVIHDKMKGVDAYSVNLKSRQRVLQQETKWNYSHLGDAGLNDGLVGEYRGDVGLNDGDWGLYLGDVGEKEGDVGEYLGLVGEYPGDVRFSAGDVGEYVGDVGALPRS